jgi:integrase
MANIKFGLNNRAETPENKPYSIYIRYKYGRNCDISKAIGFKINPKYWSEQKQNVKNKSEVINRTQINDLITNLKRHFEDFESDLLSKGQQPTNKTANKHFKSYFDQTETQKPKTLFEYIKEFKERPDVKKTKSKGTLKNYNSTENFLKRFNDEFYPIDFDNIDMDFYNDFVEWAEGQPLSKNYIGKHINTLKTFLTNATNDKININREFQNPRFKVLKETAQNIFLSMDELNEIYKKDLSHLPKLDQARDLFLIGAYTGLRVSDFNDLKPENIFNDNGKEFLRVDTKKTKKEVIIPLRPEVKAIFQKHGNKPPKRMPDQHINKKIKEVCENVGIDEVVYKEQTRGGKKIRTKNFKYDLVKTHTARRSFCTNAYLSGMNTLDIMQISGHTSEKTFLNYIKADALQKANKISEHPFFKGNTLKIVSNV